MPLAPRLAPDAHLTNALVASDGTLEYRQVDTGYEPALFLIQKFAHVPERATETGTKEVSLAEYYVLHGTIYQAPDLLALCASRVVRTSPRPACL